MTLLQLKRIHPTVTVIFRTVKGWTRLTAFEDGKELCWREGRSWHLGAIMHQLCEAVSALKRRDVGDRQGWREGATGRIEPLQFHHIKPRSKGRSDAKENLAGLSQRSHARQHEVKS